MKRKLTGILLSLLLLLSLLPAASAAEPVERVTGSPVSAALGWGGAIDANGTLWTWGYNEKGRDSILGFQPDRSQRNPPRAILENVASFCATDAGGAAIDKNGGLWVWGNNYQGCLGLGPDVKYVLEPVKVMDHAAYVDFYVCYPLRQATMAVIDTNGTLWMCGSNYNNRISPSEQASVYQLTRIMDNVADVKVQDSLVGVVDTSGGLWLWGNDSPWGLAKKLWPREDDPVISKPAKLMENVKRVEFPYEGLMAVIDRNDVLWMWGKNWGLLWNDRITEWGQKCEEPMRIMDQVRDVCVPDSNKALILDLDGGLWSLGYNSSGFLGIGSSDGGYCAKEPVKILDNVTSMATNNFAFAITGSGELYGWGFNSVGQLCGTDTHNASESPSNYGWFQSEPVKLMDHMAQPWRAGGVSPEVKPVKPLALSRTQSILVDGRPVEFEAYALKDANGYETNYIKLRDVALVLNGTTAQFQVGWDGTVNVTTGAAYTANGSELSTPFSGDRAYESAAAQTRVNGVAVTLEAILLKDDAGSGYTYYKLRDLGQALGFNVGWSAERGVYLETDRPYSGT